MGEIKIRSRIKAYLGTQSLQRFSHLQRTIFHFTGNRRERVQLPKCDSVSAELMISASGNDSDQPLALQDLP